MQPGTGFSSPTESDRRERATRTRIPGHARPVRRGTAGIAMDALVLSGHGALPRGFQEVFDKRSV
ncbi:hypothetical protein CP978_23385 [Streptomyces nodosus]|uniref:Uncharacterized protein n=1 Tax=Streptomyces nodosus TaxID=40318 RepID=A0A0B5DFW5_9ACTN|nr:hypothetical protein SNOD_23070 [Streptomyces nodosus]QEV41103.1 hypothetical protein CP978_23385 [Streptomyces nodosus]